MTKQQRVLANAEAFVRDALSIDFKQPVDNAKVATIARRVSKVIPSSNRKAAAGHKEMVAAE